MFGRVMDFQFLHQPTRVGWWEHFIQGRRGMRIQVIQHQHELLSMGIVDIDQFLRLMGDNALHDTREGEAQDDGPENLPEHAERYKERLPDAVQYLHDRPRLGGFTYPGSKNG